MFNKNGTRLRGETLATGETEEEGFSNEQAIWDGDSTTRDESNFLCSKPGTGGHPWSVEFKTNGQPSKYFFEMPVTHGGQPRAWKLFKKVSGGWREIDAETD